MYTLYWSIFIYWLYLNCYDIHCTIYTILSPIKVSDLQCMPVKKENNRLNFLFFSSGTCWWITSTTSIDTNHEAGKKVELWKHLYLLNHEMQPNPKLLSYCINISAIHGRVFATNYHHMLEVIWFYLFHSFLSQTLQIFEPMNINIFDSLAMW